MRLLFVDSSRGGWGTELHFVELVKALHAAGHDIRVVVRRQSAVHGLLQAGGVDTLATPFRGGGDPRAMWKIVQTIKTFRPQWIVTNRCKLYWPMIVLGLLFGVRVALFRHLTYLRHWHQRHLLPRLADRFYVVSNFAQDVLVSSGVCRERLTPLYNPIDTQRFTPISAAQRLALRARLGLQADDVIVGFVGRIELAKGVGPLREAIDILMARHPNLRMLWVGDGRAAPSTRAFVDSSGHAERHVFTGWQARVEDFVGALDFLVAPSLESETFGRVVAEAQACGLPVIASGAGGLREAFLPGGTGLLVEHVDVETLATAIEQLIRQPALRARLAARSCEFVRMRFSADKVAAAFARHLAATPLPACDSFAEPSPQIAHEEPQDSPLSGTLATTFD